MEKVLAICRFRQHLCFQFTIISNKILDFDGSEKFLFRSCPYPKYVIYKVKVQWTFSPKSGYIWSFSNFPIYMFAYGGAHIVPIAHLRICKYCSSLNSRLFRVSTSVNRLSIACMKVKECVFYRLCLTAFLPFSCGMFVYSDRTSIVNRNAPSGIMKSSIFVMKSVVSFT